jgi:hypothetical protein
VSDEEVDTARHTRGANMPASVVCRLQETKRDEREYAKRRERTGDGGRRRMSVYEEVTEEDTDSPKW